MESPNRTVNNRYLIQSLISNGSFGQIFSVKDIKSSETYALKMTKKSELIKNKKLVELYENEVKILKSMDHPNICKYIDDFDDLNFKYLILEYCDQGDLAHYIESKPEHKLSEEQAIQIMKQLVSAFKQMHKLKLKILHRDIKLENILLKNDIVKLADFGFSRQLDSQELAKTGCGSLYTMAPEIIRGIEYGVKVDIYSLGVVFYSMLCGVFPYYSSNEKDLLQLILRQELSFIDKNKQKVTLNDKTIKLLKMMLMFYDDERISFTELFDYLKNYYNEKIYNEQELEIKTFEFLKKNNNEGIQKMVIEKQVSTLFKVKFLGDYNVGKTTIIDKFIQLDDEETARQKRPSTIGLEFRKVQVNYRGKHMNIQIWDTSGQEKYNSLVKTYYKNTDLFVLVFNACDIYTLKNLNVWVEKIKLNCDKKNVRMLIFQNKQDLLNSEAEDLVDNLDEIYEYKEILMSQLDTQIIEISAKTGFNVKKCFQKTLDNLLESKSSDELNNENCQLFTTQSCSQQSCTC